MSLEKAVPSEVACTTGTTMSTQSKSCWATRLEKRVLDSASDTDWISIVKNLVMVSTTGDNNDLNSNDLFWTSLG